MFKLWVKTVTQERAPRQMFSSSRSTIETLEKSVKYAQG